MADWFDHPAYVPVRRHIADIFSEKVFRFKRHSPVIFLCGGKDSERRKTVKHYLEDKHNDKLVFYADDVWYHVEEFPDYNALQIEDQLGRLSDILIILVESEGTLTELGAFSHSDILRPKLLPILDRVYETDNSFINNGPIRWINQDSTFAPALYVDFEIILEVAAGLDDRLRRLPSPAVEEVEDILQSPKHMLLFVCDLVAAVGPVMSTHVARLVREVFSEAGDVSQVPGLLALASVLQMLASIRGEDGNRYYFRPPEQGLRAYQHKKLFNLAAERTRVVSVLQRIPVAATALQLASRKQ